MRNSRIVGVIGAAGLAVGMMSACDAPAQVMTVAAPAPVKTGSAALSLGDTIKVGGGQADVTVYAYKQPVGSKAPKPSQPGYAWGAADVQVCVHVNATVNQDPWTLAYADAPNVKPSSIKYGQFPVPAYASDDHALKSGACLRGWITFAVPEKHGPTTVQYSLDDGTLVEWKAPTQTIAKVRAEQP